MNRLAPMTITCAFLLALLAIPFALRAQDSSAPRSKSGKRLFGTAEALRVARVSSPRLSPDASRVAYLVAENHMEKDKDSWKTVTSLWVVPAAGPASAARQFTRGEKSVSNFSWSPDGRLLAFVMDAGDEKDAKPQVWFMYSDGGEPWQVTKHKSGVRAFEFSPDGKNLLLTATVPSTDAEEKRGKQKDDAVVVDHEPKLSQLWSWSISTSDEKQLTHSDVHISDARWSPDGSRITFSSTPSPRLDDVTEQTLWIMDASGGQPRRLVDSSEKTHNARWSPDGKWIAYLSNVGGFFYKVNLMVVAASGAGPRNLTASFELNAAEPHWSHDGKQIFFSSDDRESNKVFAADVQAASVRALTDKEAVFELADTSADGRIAVGTWSDPLHPAEIFRSDLAFSATERITDHNAWLSDYALGATEVIRWKSSRDGIEIDGIVTKPVDFDGSHKVPFLLNPHGGPTGASLLTFNPTEQIMAANGYLVLEPNFRGSTGRGEKFAQANQSEWGNGDYKDDMSGVQAMVDKGWADPDRLGAFGWSYGGYITMWIDTQTDRFKAISPGAGLPDLYSMYSQTDIHHYITMFFHGKSPWDNFQEYWDHSPMKYVSNVKTPTMILHGQSDTRVPIPQAEEFYRALLERHVPVEYVTYPRENHGFVEPHHIQDRWQRYLVFFGKYLNNPPVTEPKDTLDRMAKDLP